MPKSVLLSNFLSFCIPFVDTFVPPSFCPTTDVVGSSRVLRRAAECTDLPRMQRRCELALYCVQTCKQVGGANNLFFAQRYLFIEAITLIALSAVLEAIVAPATIAHDRRADSAQQS